MVERGTAHGLEQSTCVLGCPPPPYIKGQGGGRPALVRPKERRNPPPGAPYRGRPTSSLAPLYTGAEGAPENT